MTNRNAAPEKSFSAGDHAWRHFQLHAQQRISVFNYFVALSSSLAGAIVLSLFYNADRAFIAGLGGILLTGLSFIFWKLDQRVAAMIKTTEDVLISIEAEMIQHPDWRVMSLESAATRSAVSSNVLTGQWTYGRSFRLIFVTMGVLGIAGAAAALGQAQGWISTVVFRNAYVAGEQSTDQKVLKASAPNPSSKTQTESQHRSNGR